MKITLQAVRIYGAKSQYGSTPRFCPSDGPIILDSFPGKTERSLIFLGTPPESILRANKVRKAIVIVARKRLFGKAPDPEANPDMLIEKELGEPTDFPISDYNWYITIVVEREVDVTNADITDSKYLWLNWGKALEIEEEFESYASPHIDLLATYASTIIEPTFFGEVIIDDHVFFSAATRESFGLPRFLGGSAVVAVTLPTESLNLEMLKQLLQGVASLPENQHQWLKYIKHYRLSAISEKDPMKRFLWSYFALELLTHKLADMLYDGVMSNLHLRVKESDIASVPIPFSELVGSKERLPLRAKFAIAALGLFPDSAETDVKLFASAKDARDDLVHGKLEEVDELPISTVSALLEKYLAGAVELQLKL